MWLLKQQSDEKKWQEVIEPKLLKHLLMQPKQQKSKIAAPWHLGIVLSLIVLALSGPSWVLKDSPFTKDDTKIALLISVKESMLSSDIQPNRLERTTIKVADLLEQRADTQTSLVAYSGTAHLVLPLTQDHSIINTFTQALDVSIMPLEGDNIKEALLLAQKELNVKGSTIIVLTDSVSPSSVKLALKEDFDESINVIFWKIASKELSSESDFKNAASVIGGHYVPYSADGSDVVKVSSLIDKSFKNAEQDDKNKYEDGGYTLIPVIFLLLLLWFRQGFIAELWRRS